MHGFADNISSEVQESRVNVCLTPGAHTELGISCLAVLQDQLFLASPVPCDLREVTCVIVFNFGITSRKASLKILVNNLQQLNRTGGVPFNVKLVIFFLKNIKD